MKRRRTWSRWAALLTGAFMVGALAVAPAAVASTGSRATTVPYLSLGTEICANTTPFVFMVFGSLTNLGVSDPHGVCDDQGVGSLDPGPAKYDLLVDLDNQSGHRAWVQGYNASDDGNDINWCYDPGYDFTLGPPVDGGTGPSNIAFSAAQEGSAATCTGVPPDAAGSTEPGAVPNQAPDCSGKGSRVVLWYQKSSFNCYSPAPGRHNVPSATYLAVVNGATHYMLVSGNGFTACVDANHVISPLNPKYDNFTSITISDGGPICPLAS